MAASSLIETYRFSESSGTYESFTTIIYFHDEAMLVGLDKGITPKQYREIKEHLKNKGVQLVRYVRKGKVKVRIIK